MFEAELCSYTNAKYCSVVANASVALKLAYMALEVGQGDIVWIANNTFASTATSAISCGARIVPIEICLDTFNFDLNILDWMLRDALENDCLPKVVAVVDFGGLPSASSELHQMSKTYGFRILVDSAHGIGSRIGNNQSGSNRYSDITVFSFHAIKVITTGEGGAVLTNNLKFHTKVKHLSTTARSGYEYVHDEPAFNYRMTNVQAAIGCAQLERFKEFIESKKIINEYYKKNINSTRVAFPKNENSSHWLSYLIAKNLKKHEIYSLYSFASDKGVYLRPFWVPMHKQPPYKKSLSSTLTNSKKIYSKVVTLPSSTSLKKTDLKYIVTVINSYLESLDG